MKLKRPVKTKRIMNSGDGIQLKGYIDLEFRNEKDGIYRKMPYTNLITNVGKQLMLDMSAKRLMYTGGNIFGMMCINSDLNAVDRADTSANNVQNYNKEKCLANVLLNVGGESVNLSAETSYIHVWDNDMAQAVKVTGYAGGDMTPTDNGKEGALIDTKSDFAVSGYIQAGRWLYKAGVATGDIDVVAMMPLRCVKDVRGDGLSLSKCIDKVNVFDPNFIACSTAFLPPGVTGYTASDEVMLNYNIGGNNKHIYNINTGEVRDITDTVTNFATVCDALTLDYFIEGNYFYRLYTDALDGANIIAYVDVYDITNGFALLKKFYASAERLGEVCAFRFLRLNGKVYVTIGHHAKTTATDRYFELTKVDNAYYDKISYTALKDYNTIIQNIPAGVSHELICFGNYGDNYVMYVTVKHTDFVFRSDNAITKGYIFTDINNIGGTIIDCVNCVTPNAIPYSSGANKGYIKIGMHGSNARLALFNSATSSLKSITSLDAEEFERKVTMGGASKNIFLGRVGCFLTKDKWWTNVVSLRVLPTLQLKTIDDDLYTGYGYAVQ